MSGRRRRAVGVAARLAFVAALAALSPQDAFAQDRPQRPAGNTPRREQIKQDRSGNRAEKPDGPAKAKRPNNPPGDGAERGPEGGPPFGMDLPFRLGRRLAPAAEDAGPLRPGEADELMAFAGANSPFLFENLDTLREKNPGAFRARLAEMAPRIRFLRRLRQAQPGIGRLVLKHIENEARLRRLRREFESAPAEAKRRLMRAARTGPIADNIRIEIDLMRGHVEDLRKRRENIVDAQFQRLTAPNADLSDESDEMRYLIDGWAGAAADQKSQAGAAVRELLGQRVDDEISEVDDRRAQREKSVDEEADRKTRRMFSPRPP